MRQSGGNLAPVISVIVPVYNVEPYLEECVRSIQNQSLREIEIILVDDGSPDNCPQMCDRYAGEDGRIRVIHQKNAGVSAARNAGLRAARGDYIAFVDSDDWVHPDYLSVMQEHMHPGGMAACQFVCEWDPTEKARLHTSRTSELKTLVLDRTAAQAAVLCGGEIDGHLFCKLFDRRSIDKHRVAFCEDLSYAEDGLFVMQYLSCLSAQIIVVKTALYYYQYRGQSATNQRIRRYQEFDPQIFSENIAVDRQFQYIEHTPDLLRCYAARQTAAKKAALAVMEINGWKERPEYKLYLKELRANLFHYLKCGKGPLNARACTVLCAIHPRLYYLSLKAWTFIWEHRRGTR